MNKRIYENLFASYNLFETETKKSLKNIFSTHPPIEERIARLKRMKAV